MKLVFDEKALVDLEGIYNWIAKDNAAAALAVAERVFASVEHLATFPHRDMPGATKARRNGSCRGCLTLSSTKSMPSGMRSLSWPWCTARRIGKGRRNYSAWDRKALECALGEAGEVRLV